MKNLLVLFCLVFNFSNLFAQKIFYIQDDMTDKIYYFFDDKNDKSSLLVSEDGKEGLIIRVFFWESGGTSLVKEGLTLSYLNVKMVLDGLNCVEGGFMIIRFENGERIRLKNLMDFNCDNEFYFDLGPHLDILFAEKIDRIMVEEGRSYRSYTHSPENPEYFIELGKVLGGPFIRGED